VEYGEEVINQLLLTKFAISKNEQSEAACSNASFFVRPAHPNVIFVCGSTRNGLRNMTLKKLLMSAQIIIHEGAHLVNYTKNNYTEDDECSPTDFELAIMENNFGKKNIPTMVNRDGYKAQCGFAR